MNKMRLLFRKTGRAIYISHLDLMRTMQRSFSRAGFSLKYSEGFNPHPQISILMPLSVGTASQCERMDFTIHEEVPPDEIVERLNRAFPEGIEAVRVYEPVRKASEIKWLQVEGILEYDSRPPEELCPRLTAFFDRTDLAVEKKTKSGMSQISLQGNVKNLELSPVTGGVGLRALISANDPVMNPDMLAAALRLDSSLPAPDFSRFQRVAVFDSEMHPFE